MGQLKVHGIIEQLAKRERIAATIWGLVGCGQIALGVLLFWPSVAVGVLNLLAVPSRIQQSRIVLKRVPTLLEDYNAWGKRIMINLAINLVLGLGVGGIGSIYDILLRRYVEKNAKQLQHAIQLEGCNESNSKE